jgi:hypothetical protein
MGSEERRRTIADVVIENRGPAGDGYHYRAKLSQVSYPALGVPQLNWVGDVVGWDRKQSVWNLIGEVIQNAGVSNEAVSSAHRRGGEQHTLGLFLDILPDAWGLSESDFEKLIDLPEGWLRAWRNHEVEIDDELASDLLKLGTLQIGMRLVRTPGNYAGFWRHRWRADSPIGARSPWQAFEEDGWSAVEAITSYLRQGLQ